jgi:hypothetical protein
VDLKGNRPMAVQVSIDLQVDVAAILRWIAAIIVLLS